MSKKQIYYSDKYTDEEFEYRHVMLPKDLAKMVPKTHLMSETEWRNLGVQQSQGNINLVKVLLLIFRCNFCERNDVMIPLRLSPF
jgi:cyclin-dependent kinase regulatory subunit CKS1